MYKKTKIKLVIMKRIFNINYQEYRIECKIERFLKIVGVSSDSRIF